MSKEQKERKLREFQKVALSKAFGFSSSATTSSISSILEAATEPMPSSSGKKPGQSGRHGGRQSLSSPRDTTGFRPRITVAEEHSSGARDTSEFQPRETASDLQSSMPTDTSGSHEPQSSERLYTCTWIKDTKAYMETKMKTKLTLVPCGGRRVCSLPVE